MATLSPSMLLAVPLADPVGLGIHVECGPHGRTLEHGERPAEVVAADRSYPVRVLAARTVALEAETVTSRYESALDRPDLLNAFDALTIRAVRIVHTVLSELGRFVKPGGLQFFFQRVPMEFVPGGPPRQTHQLTSNAVLDVVQKSL